MCKEFTNIACLEPWAGTYSVEGGGGHRARGEIVICWHGETWFCLGDLETFWPRYNIMTKTLSMTDRRTKRTWTMLHDNVNSSAGVEGILVNSTDCSIGGLNVSCDDVTNPSLIIVINTVHTKCHILYYIRLISYMTTSGPWLYNKSVIVWSDGVWRILNMWMGDVIKANFPPIFNSPW